MKGSCFFPARRLALAAGLLTLVQWPLPAAPLLDDTFTNGTRTNQNLPTQSAWYFSDPYDLTVQPGNLSVLPSVSPGLGLTYFTAATNPVALQVGAKLVLTARVLRDAQGATSTTVPTLRLGLFDFADGTLGRASADGFGSASQGNGVSGYALFQQFSGQFSSANPMAWRKRTNLADGSLLETPGDWTSLGQGPGNTNGFSGFATNIPYVLTLALERLATNSLTLTATWSNTINGRRLSTQRTDTNASTFRFDGLGVWLNNGAGAGAGLTLQEVKVQFYPYPPPPPTILTSPTNQTVAAGRDATFGVQADGAEPLSYQWFFENNLLAGATTTRLTVSNVQAAMAGFYTVVVSNVSGLASNSASLTVTPAPPTIVVEPQNVAGLLCGPASLSVRARGTEPFIYQWLREGQPLAGATNSSLSFPSLKLSDAGHYQVVLYNGVGWDESWPVVVSVSPVAVWGSTASEPVPGGLSNVVGIAAGQAGKLALEANGSVFSWGGRVGLPPLTNVVAVAAGDTLAAALQNDGTVAVWTDWSWTNGFFSMVLPVSNIVAIACGSTHMLALRDLGLVEVMGLNNGTAYLKVPAGLSNVVAVAAGDHFSLVQRADGKLLAWGDNTYGQTNVPPGLSNVVAIACGPHHALALKSNGTVVAWGRNEAGQTQVPAGLSNVVAITAGGSAEGGYSTALRANGTVVTWGASTQKPTPAELTNMVAIAGGQGCRMGLIADGPPLLSQVVAQRTLPAGGTFSLVSSARSLLPLTYQWRFNGTNLAGATRSTLSLTNLALSQGGTYSLVVSNAAGMATNTTVVAVVPVRIELQPQDQAAPIGSNVTFSVVASGMGPLRFQWRCNGLDLPGATNRTLRLDHLQVPQVGRYSVRVSNSLGQALSAEVWLTVNQILAWGRYLWGSSPAPTYPLLRGASQIVGVSCSSSYNLALQADGTVRSWGNYPWEPPAEATNLVAIAAGPYQVVALRADGTVLSWGESAPPAGLSNVVAIATGSSHHLALQADSTVVGWGANTKGQTNVPAGLSNVVAIAAGGDFSLALRADGQVVAWGDNMWGQTNVPASLTNVVAIAAGSAHALALRADGRVFGWGVSIDGETKVPPGLSNVVAIAAGRDYSLALRNDGTVATWGAIFPFPAGVSNVVAIAAGDAEPLALLGSGLPVLPGLPAARTLAAGTSLVLPAWPLGSRPVSYQWSFNGRPLPSATSSPLWVHQLQPAQAGIYSVVASNRFGSATQAICVAVAPALITATPRSQATVLGDTVHFDVGLSGRGPFAYQWRKDGHNLPGATDSSLVLPRVQPGAAGCYSVLVSNAFGTLESARASLDLSQVLCWGSPTVQALPAGLLNVVGMAAGSNHLVALRADGTVLAWGDNTSGQTNVPYGLSDVVAVAAAGQHSLALRADGKVVGWGNNHWGQATPPAGLDQVAAIAAGPQHSLALRHNGTVVAWGRGDSGQTNVPVGLNNVVSIAAGVSTSFAILADGSVRSWGAPSNLPLGLTNVVALSLNGQHGIALQANGNAREWGFLSTVAETGLAAVAAGPGFSLLLKTNGTVLNWNTYPYWYLTSPAQVSNLVTAVAAGDSFQAVLLGLPPWLATHPQSQQVNTGAAVTLSVTNRAAGPVQYQWCLNGTPVAGATNASFTLPQARAQDSGLYSVVLSNRFGTTTSYNARLTVEQPPSLAHGRWTDRGFAFDLEGETGRQVLIQASTNLMDWQTLGLCALTGPASAFTNTAALSGEQAFYRLLLEPVLSVPTLAFQTPAAQGPLVVSSNTLSLAGTADNLVGAAALTWSNDRGGSGTALGVSSWTVPSIALQPGRNVLTVTGWGENGLWGSARLTVNYCAPNAKRGELDFNGDGQADLAVYTGSAGDWYVQLNSGITNGSFLGGAQSSFQWGWSTAQPVRGDFDGDGRTDYAVYDPAGGDWYIRFSSGGSAKVHWGFAGVVPVVGDFNGDGRTDLAVYYPSNGTWYIKYSGTNAAQFGAGAQVSIPWGRSQAVPVTGDYDGDGLTDCAVYDPASGDWYIRFSSGGTTKVAWGQAGGQPVAGDFNGDGRTDLGLYYPASGQYLVKYSGTSLSTFDQGDVVNSYFWVSGGVPVPGDYDGDGRTDYAIYQEATGTWVIQCSRDGWSTQVRWGWVGATAP